MIKSMSDVVHSPPVKALTSLRVRTLGTISLFVLGSAGCQDKQSVTAAEWASLQTQIGILTSQIKSLDDKIDALAKQPIAQQSPDVRPAWVSATDSGYSLAHTTLGPIAVSVAGAEKYLDGYKVQLQLGNITSATLSNVHVTVAWGFPPKTKDIEVMKSLLPGTFTPTEILLSPAEASEIKILSVGVVPNKIFLRTN